MAECLVIRRDDVSLLAAAGIGFAESCAVACPFSALTLLSDADVS